MNKIILMTVLIVLPYSTFAKKDLDYKLKNGLTSRIEIVNGGVNVGDIEQNLVLYKLKNGTVVIGSQYDYEKKIEAGLVDNEKKNKEKNN